MVRPNDIRNLCIRVGVIAMAARISSISHSSQPVRVPNSHTLEHPPRALPIKYQTPHTKLDPKLKTCLVMNHILLTAFYGHCEMQVFFTDLLKLTRTLNSTGRMFFCAAWPFHKESS